MASTKLQAHPSLPAPVILSVPQSKSHLLAGVQDAYWSDEEEDQECPLCLEEMDISDLNFKPCVCGYQICRFCWHHIKENLNKRCPACRRIYTDEGIEFKPVATQDHKRLTQQKKQRDREKKELETLGRRNLANVRVVQRSVVYVVGISPRFAKEELIPTLRSNEYFGQYGKISKILIVKRSPPGGTGPVIGLYITYNRREDAARAIAAVDGAPSPGGGREVMRASYGTTKYCMAFLRNVTCNDQNCMNLHEWGDEKDCFTKEDLSTLKHTMKATENRVKTTALAKKEGEDATLPRAASWGQKSTGSASNMISHAAPATSSPIRQTRRSTAPRQPRGLTASSQIELKSSHARTAADRKPAVTTATQVSASRPSTPAIAAAAMRPPRSTSPVVEPKSILPKKEHTSIVRGANSPAPSLATASDTGSAFHASGVSLPSRPTSTDSAISPVPDSHQSIPIPAIPPGLSAPPGIPSPSRPPRHATESPRTPLLASQSSYQMSLAARALLDDFNARMEVTPPSTVISPFPEFDRTLQTLSGNSGGGFSFNLDPKLADEVETIDILPELEMETNTPFLGSYVDAFPSLRPSSQLVPPPGLGYPRATTRSIFDPISNRGLGASPAPADKLSNYMGSFNPFSDIPETSASSSPNPSSPLLSIDEERKVSRFGFARGRQSASIASSPLNAPSHLSIVDGNGLHAPADDHPPGLSQLRWDSPALDYGHSHPPSMMGSPLISSQLAYTPQARFQPFDNDISEAQLREFIQVSRDREFQSTVIDGHGVYKSRQEFTDPAIMSASFGPPSRDMSFSPMAYGPPPGLGMFPTGNQSLNPHSNGVPALADSNPAAADFPALVPATPKEDPSPTKASASLVPHNKNQEKRSSRKAVKKAGVTEQSGEKSKSSSERPTAFRSKAFQGRPDRELKEEASAPCNVSISTSPISPRSSDKDVIFISPVVQAGPSKPEVDSKPERSDEEEVRKAEKLTRKEEKSNSKEKTPAAQPGKRSDSINVTAAPKLVNRLPKAQGLPSTPSLESQLQSQVPILSKKPKKIKPVSKLFKPPKEDDSVHDAHRHVQTTNHSGASSSSKVRSPSQSPDRRTKLSAQELLEEISRAHPGMDLISHPFFDLQKLSSTTKMSLEYGPLVHALSALSVGGGSFANNVPSGSIDTAVSSFQQLLETLTQTISDLLRLLPRTTWDDSSSFDGVLRDMLKGDDFLDEGGEDGHGKDDEVAALTLALERRARWMEVQLSKLEELHRDINTAAVKAVLAFNDNGWDKHGFFPRLGNSYRRFENIGFTQEENGDLRPMTADELEKKLAVAKEAAIFAEAEAREAMSKLQSIKRFDGDLY